MRGKKMIFYDKKINKSDLYKNKSLFSIYDIQVDRILISKKGSYGKKSSFKCFLGYNDDDVIKLLQMIGYVKHFNNNKTMSFNFIMK